MVARFTSVMGKTLKVSLETSFMAHFSKCVVMSGFLSASLAFGQKGPAPRPSVADYPASKVQSVYAIGVRQLSKAEVRNLIATPLASRYIVVEVGFYPAGSNTIGLQQSDFSLRTADGKAVASPASPQTIAAIYQNQPQSSRDVTLYPTANVGYVSGPDYSGSGRRVSGPVYGIGTGVGVDKNTSPAATDADRQTLEMGLHDKELKDEEVSRPVAGYLYFPVPTKRKPAYQLQYRGTGVVTSLPLKVQ